MLGIKKIVVSVIICVSFIMQNVYASQIQIYFYGTTSAGKEITALVLDKELDDRDISSSNIKYINQFKADSEGRYSISFPMEVCDSEYVFRTNQKDGTTRQVAKAEQTLYVSNMGSDLNDGSDEKPFKTLDMALSSVLPNLKTIIILRSDERLEKLPGIEGATIEIKGETPITLTLPDTICCNSNLLVDNLKLTKSTIYANGHNLTIGENVTSDERLNVYGGCNGMNLNGNTNICLRGGKYQRVYGGSLNASVTGNTNITFGGNCNLSDSIDDSSSSVSPCYVYGGGNNGAVSGETNVVLDGKAVTRYIVGSGYGSGGSVGVSTNIRIKGGSVMNVYAGSAASAPTLNCDTNITMTGGIAESLFGGSEGTNLTGNTHLYLFGGEVTRRIFSGCYNGTSGLIFISIATSNHIIGTTTIVIDNDAKLITNNGLSSSNKMNSGIFSGSRIASKNAQEVNTLIFLNDSYNGKKSLIGDKSGYGSTFKSFETYTVKAGKGGSVDTVSRGVIALNPDIGMVAQVGEKIYGVENTNISAGTTEVKFVKDFIINNVTADKTNKTVSVEYIAENYENEPEPKLFVAVYEKFSDNSNQLVKVNISEFTNGTTASFNLGDDLEAGKTYIIKAMMFNKNQRPLTNYYEIKY